MCEKDNESAAFVSSCEHQCLGWADEDCEDDHDYHRVWVLVLCDLKGKMEERNRPKAKAFRTEEGFGSDKKGFAGLLLRTIER